MSEDKNYIPKILDVILWPDNRLHQKSEEVTKFNVPELEHLIADMFTTMRARGGVGLAAPQVGHLQNVLIIELEKEIPLVLINPKIKNMGKKTFEWEEGCLSVPGYFEKRERNKSIIVKHHTIKGERIATEFHGLYAFAIQHEFDHLTGKVFVDDKSWLKKGMIKKKIKKSLPGIINNMNKVKQSIIDEGTPEIDILKAKKHEG